MDKGQKHGRYIFSGQTLTLKEMVLRISQELDIKPKIIRVPDILLFAILRIKSFVCNFIFDFDKGFKRFALYNDEILLFLSGNLVADDSYATIDLDWNPKISIENGFKDMVTDQVSSL
jgi:nucleoside-diphosphate-sugar epimerase